LCALKPRAGDLILDLGICIFRDYLIYEFDPGIVLPLRGLLPAAHRGEDVYRIILHDPGLEFFIGKLHIAPVDKKVDVPVHIPVLVQ
jgi:hypothetical protein